MKLTDVFIRRPVLAIVVNLVIVIAGIQAIRGINVRQYPRSENAAVTVTTTYVGANAALVRGFVTTPLERVIAAADGVDYIESQSTQNLSTIRAHLRLNFDATRALAEIGSKVDQVRADLPPEAEIPILNVESVDSQFASAYLSFSSDLLKQNEITDYLVRVVQPRLSCHRGRAARGHPRRADLRDADLAQARSDGGPQREPVPGPPGARGEQLPRGGGPDQGLAGPGEPDRQHRPALGPGVPAAGGPRAGRRGGAARRRGRRGAGRGGLRRGGELQRPDRGVHRGLAAARAPTPST